MVQCICGPLLNWFIIYLINRFQRVVIPGGVSSWLEILAGVPQTKGSILGPLLFIIFINDIVKEIHSNIRFFADDTSLYIVADFPDSAAHTLKLDSIIGQCSGLLNLIQLKQNHYYSL